jgi:hypothetical protein
MWPRVCLTVVYVNGPPRLRLPSSPRRALADVPGHIRLDRPASERHYAVEVGGDLGGDGPAAAAFDEAGCVEAVQRVDDGEELLLCLLGAERLAQLVFGDWALALVGAHQQGFEDGFVVVALLG